MADRSVKYGQPRRINAFSVTLLLGFLAFVYLAWRFGPVYLDAWSVDHSLKEGATEVYRMFRLPEDTRINLQNELVERIVKDIRKKAGITDPELEVSLDVDEETQTATMTATYHVIVSDPLSLLPPADLHMVREQTMSLKKVEWE